MTDRPGGLGTLDALGRRLPLDRLDRYAPWLLGLGMFALCVSFMPDYPTEWDSIQLTLGVDRFDVTAGSPHPPGYWLYLALARAVRFLTPLDAPTSLSVLSAAAAGTTVALTYVIGRTLAGRWLGLAAAAFLVTSPFMLFYGSTVSTYAFDALVASVLVLLAVHARPGSWHGWAAAATLGLGAGLRQTTLLVLGPVALVAAVRSVRSVRAGLAVVGAGAMGILVWAVPMVVEQPGGLTRYRAFSDEYLRPALEATSILSGAPLTGVVNNLGQATAYTIGSVLVLLPVAVVGAALAVTFARRERLTQATPAARMAALVLALVVMVSLAFVFLVHFGKAGYVLSFLPALALLLLYPAARLPRLGRAGVGVLLALACLLDFQRFTSAAGILPLSMANKPSLWFTQERHGAPFRLTKPLMNQTDRETKTFLALRDEFDPDRDVLVYVAHDGGHRFRHAAYTLPDFTTYWVVGGVHAHTSVDRHMTYDSDHEIEVPPGGQAVWVIDVPFPETIALQTQGRVRRHTLATGPTVWVSGPDVTMFGVTVVEAER